MRPSRGQAALPYLFLLPALLFILAIFLVPLVFSVAISLTDWDGISMNFRFIGLDNFLNGLQDAGLRAVLGNTVVYFVEIVVIQNLLGLFLAVLLDGRFRGQTFFRATLFMPTVIATIAVGFLWNLMLDPVSGPVSWFLNSLPFPGFQDLVVLGNTSTAIHAVTFVNIWQWTGWSMVIFIAGLQSIDRSLYEACDIDGASRWQQFRHVSLPLLAPAITVNVVVSSIGAFKIFDLPFIMTQGGPGHASESLTIAIYNNSFLLNKMGYGTAISLFLCAFIIVFSGIQTKYLRRREDDVL